MVVIIDSKIFLYTAIQQGKLSVEMFELIIDELSKAYSQVPDRQPINAVVFAGDLGKSSYRLALSPTYKAHRTHKADYKEAMENYVGLIPNLAKTLGFTPMFVKDVEADDIAGILTNVLTFNTKEQILLLTNDRDWSQISLRYPKVFIKFTNRQNLYLRGDIVAEEEVNDYFEFLLKKAIVSDRGDGILGLHKVGIRGYQKFLIYLKNKYPEFDSLTASEKYRTVMDNINYFEKYNPHESYLKINPEMTVAEAIKLNFQLGEIMTTVMHLTKEQKDAMGECVESLRRLLKKPKTPNINPVITNLDFEAFDRFIEEHMPNELNDFGHPYTLPDWYKATLIRSLRGML